MLPYISGEFRVASDIDIQYSGGGVPYARFRAVADKKKKEGDNWVDDKVFWVSVTAFGKTAENLAESAAKGSIVNVVGRIETREYEKEGQKRSDVAIAADSVSLSLARDSYGGAAQAKPAASAGSDNPWGTPAGQDEAPF